MLEGLRYDDRCRLVCERYGTVRCDAMRRRVRDIVTETEQSKVRSKIIDRSSFIMIVIVIIIIVLPFADGKDGARFFRWMDSSLWRVSSFRNQESGPFDYYFFSISIISQKPRGERSGRKEEERGQGACAPRRLEHVSTLLLLPGWRGALPTYWFDRTLDRR